MHQHMFSPNKFRFVATNIRSFMFVKPFARLLRYFSICSQFSSRYIYILYILYVILLEHRWNSFGKTTFWNILKKKWMCLIRGTFSAFAAFVFSTKKEKEYLYGARESKKKKNKIWNTMLSDKRKIVLLNLFPNCSLFFSLVSISTNISISYYFFSSFPHRRRRRHCYTTVAMAGVMQK